MSGARIHCETLRSGVLAVEHPTKKYRLPYACPKCNVVHLNKVIHIAIDSEGYGIVSYETLELLRQSGMPGLTYTNEVANPPTQGVSTEDRPKIPSQDSEHFVAPTFVDYKGRFPGFHVLKNRLTLVKGRPDG